MKIVILDGVTVNPGDLSWDGLAQMGELEVYDRTSPDEIIKRISGADAVFTSKCKITAEVMDSCPSVKFIATLATGYDNIDVAAAKERGIAVCNVPAYSTASVTQHVFALLLEITNGTALHANAVEAGEWTASPDFCLIKQPVLQLAGRSLGIIGYGNIGKSVGKVAEAFGMTVNVYSKDPEAAVKSDIITLHCPATPDNLGFINKDFISRMKDGAILINTARGALINEQDLADALKSGKLAAAAVDVLNGEPPRMDNPLLNAPNIIVTPHVAWASGEACRTICETCVTNLQSWLDSGDVNRIV